MSHLHFSWAGTMVLGGWLIAMTSLQCMGRAKHISIKQVASYFFGFAVSAAGVVLGAGGWIS